MERKSNGRIASPKHIVMLLLLLFLVLLGIATVDAWRSIAIKRYPSCLTYQSEGNARLGSALSTSINGYLVANGFKASSADAAVIKWESGSTLVQFGNGSRLWLSICTKDESYTDWLAVAKSLQELEMSSRWSPAAFLDLNPELTGCRAKNEMQLDYPVDFQRIRGSFERLKATCKGGPSRIN